MSSIPREALNTRASKPGVIGVASSTLSALALARLEAETDPVMLMGRRKIVRKWREEVARSQMVERAKALIARGDEDGAVAAFNEFRAWMKRPDRKSFDLTG
jgi:hypothetical protein